MSKNKSILIIDDDKYILSVFSKILNKQGYIVENAETGREAMEMITKKQYDLVLIDVKLPDVEGPILVEKMNKINPDMIKIVITGFPSIEDANKVMDEGATAYLVKPVKSEELVKFIDKKLNK
ncbi:MAG: response regulator [Candidatus Bathyarchaeota archaeon]|nr:MAG: response regulator [Candidatus Bathyarchaeota archaeon]